MKGKLIKFEMYNFIYYKIDKINNITMVSSLSNTGLHV